MSSIFVFKQVEQSPIDWVAIASVVTSVIYATYIHHYVVRLERIGCDCAIDFRRIYIQWFTLALIIIGVINIALRLTGGDVGLAVLSMVLSPIMFVATLLYVIYVIQYINRLRKEKCTCSEGMARSILYIVTIINVILACLLALVILSAVLSSVSSSQSRRRRG